MAGSPLVKTEKDDERFGVIPKKKIPRGMSSSYSFLPLILNHADCQPEERPTWTFTMRGKADQKDFMFRQSNGLIKNGTNHAYSKPATE